MSEVVDGDIRDVLQGFVVLFLFMCEFEVLHKGVEVVQSHGEVVDEVLNIRLELVVVFCWYLSLVDGSWTHILHFFSLHSMRSKGHDSF